MIIGVVSDSHDNIHLLRKALKSLVDHKVEMVIHLGDIISPFSVKLMKEVLGGVPVVAVKGNNDGDVYQIAQLFSKYNWQFYSEPTIVNLGNRRILLLHGYGSVENTRSLAWALLQALDIDAVLYGHTHQIEVEKRNEKLILNPGEVCGYLTGKGSYALIETKSMKTEVHVLDA